MNELQQDRTAFNPKHTPPPPTPNSNEQGGKSIPTDPIAAHKPREKVRSVEAERWLTGIMPIEIKPNNNHCVAWRDKHQRGEEGWGRI